MGLISIGSRMNSVCHARLRRSGSCRHWSGCLEALVDVGGKKVYPSEIWLAAVRDVIGHGMSLTWVMAEYNMASRSPVSQWCSESRAGKLQALCNQVR